MKAYKLCEGGVLKTVTNTCVPFADGNRDYEEYQQWLAKGNTPDPADVPEIPMVSESELKAQIKENIERGEYADAIAKMAKLVGVQ